MTASDAFPIIGSMDAFKNMEHFDQQILCGEKIIEPRLSNIHLRIPQPQPNKNKSIYEIQKAMNPSDLIMNVATFITDPVDTFHVQGLLGTHIRNLSQPLKMDFYH